MNKLHTLERLDKFLSHAGVAARRDIKRLLKQNDVTVNGKRVKTIGVRIDPSSDIVSINAVQVHKQGFVYFALNKPINIISTTDDPGGRTNVVDLIDTTEKIFPVGRLDKDTHGLLLLTNDGELTHKLIHPKYHVPKVYCLTISGEPTEEQLHAFRTGVLLRDGITLPSEIKIIKQTKEQTLFEMILHEGRNRQIRRMCETVGLELLDLQRIQFGPIKLGELKDAEYRKLNEEEATLLREAL